jgi:myo-inositol-1-phosphate synthase
MPVGESWAIADREFYVSHGYNTSQAFAQRIPVTEGTLIVYASRVSTDQVAGFGSSMKKKIGRTVMAKHLTDVFERSRASFR